jgi:DNA polymerase II large subunit
MIKEYLDLIEKEVYKAYEAANLARAKGFDPSNSVEIPLARNMAERVEGLVSSVSPQIKDTGIPERIIELEKKFGKLDWRVAFEISLEVAQETFCKFKDKREAMEVGIRIGIAYVTNGVVASPLEGFTKLEIRKTLNGEDYFAIFFSGPIRSAGGTGASVSVLISDYMRKKMGYSKYDPTELEVKRYMTEILDYHERITNLQYFPSPEEIEFFMSHIPIQIEGEPSEKFDVSNYKDLDRVNTNKLRSGVCLTIGEGLTQKATKLWKQIGKWGKEMDMEDWFFLEEFLKLQKNIKARNKKDDEGTEKIKPDFTYISDIVAGRPVLGHPLRNGSFRLRYGRGRNTGLSGTAIHPATMVILKEYIAIGTQLKWERPSKGTAVGSCDSIEGPIVKLTDGSVKCIDSYEDAKKYTNDVEEIIYLGDALVPYGDFLDRGHILIPAGYCEEWWLHELKNKIKDEKDFSKKTELNEFIYIELLKNFNFKISFDEARIISEKLKIPLHPKYTFHWKSIDKDMLKSLLEWIDKGSVNDDKIVLPYSYDLVKDIEDKDAKIALELLGVEHQNVNNEFIAVEGDFARALLFSLNYNDLKFDSDDVLEIINDNIKVKIKDKNGTFIGARMGRPEKAKIRKMTGSPHVLFPVGEEGGRMRSFNFALERSKINAQFPIYQCEICDFKTVYPYCIRCNGKTEKYSKLSGKYVKGSEGISYETKGLEIEEYFNHCLNTLGTASFPDVIKGVRGTGSADHTPENLIKGILRATHGIQVNKDGTTRYDMTELPLTHFKPKEIGTSIEKLKSLGYEKDIYEKDLIDENQILEIKPQDVVLPGFKDRAEEGCDEILFRTANFVDALLDKFYKLPKYYNLKDKKDITGHLVVALAPHISAGTVCRIIGFSKTQAFYAHPLMHCAVRRDCDGDEVAIILLMDSLLNFSRKYLPSHRGARQDTPLVITPFLIPSEVDDMVFNMDIVKEYPLELYEAAEQYKYPWEVKIERVGHRLGKYNEDSGYMFTHDTSDLNLGVKFSAYKLLPTMEEKVLGQMELSRMIRAVDEDDVARLVVDRHFMRDIRGNLRKFSQQEFRCVSCNTKYRRPPLIGNCLKCGGKIIFTVSEGSIIKYLEPSLSLAEKFNLSPYLQQTLELTKMMIESIFGRDKEKQEGLGKWF